MNAQINLFVADNINAENAEFAGAEMWNELDSSIIEDFGGEEARDEFIEVWNEYRDEYFDNVNEHAYDAAEGYSLEIYKNGSYASADEVRELASQLGSIVTAHGKCSIKVSGYYGDAVAMINALGFETDEDEISEE